VSISRAIGVNIIRISPIIETKGKHEGDALHVGATEHDAPSAFVAALSGIFEHSPWVAEHGGEAAVREHRRAARDDVERGGNGRRRTPARADQRPPGTGRQGGRARRAHGRVDARASGAGLDQCTQEEFDKLLTLNRTYREKFGFPFILAVRGYDRHGIIANFESRVKSFAQRGAACELDQIYRIARFRLDDLIDA
jgi:2-oxo-4-hydroxy-4-carboxy-5-ureidoimidazoline decarboxylase